MKYFIFFVIVLTACNHNSKFSSIYNGRDCDSAFKFVEIGELNHSLSKYDQQQVETSGYYYWGSEQNSIGQYHKSNEKKSLINMNVTKSLADTLQQMFPGKNPFQEFAGKKIKIRGIVNSNSDGHLGQYAGTIIVCYLEILD